MIKKLIKIIVMKKENRRDNHKTFSKNQVK